MKTLSIDIETYGDIDLRTAGVYKYVDDESFEILLFSYSDDGETVKCIDLASGEALNLSLINDLLNDNVIKTAFNANFERVCLMKYLSRLFKKGIYLSPQVWRCTQIQSAYLGLPLNLDGVAKVLNLSEQKMSEGKALIRYFCTPCKATHTNGMRIRNLPFHDQEKWESFKQYNIQDVKVELQIRKKLKKFELPAKEQRLYELDQKINDCGIKVDQDLVNAAIFLDETTHQDNLKKAYELTGLENPNSVAQLKHWLQERNIVIDSLSNKNVKKLIQKTDDEVKELLNLRLAMSKTSVKKYEAIKRSVCSDGRVHGLFQFYGANRSGRWCLAEGSLIKVKTRDGKITDKPIEKVLIEDQVWDGIAWVHHEGIVFSGEKEVMIWDNITATREHIVYISDQKKMTLAEAKMKGVKLWSGKLYFKEDIAVKTINKTKALTYDILNAGHNNRFMANGKIVSNSGRLVQFQNLPRNSIEDLEIARSLVKHRQYEDIDLLFKDVSNTLSELIRTAFIPEEEHEFIVVDYASIEARVLSYVANERWRLDVFDSHGKMYEATAAKIFNVPMEEITKDSPLRQRGKISELACGYGGSVGALKAMGAIEMGLEELELQELINNWRRANPNIVKLWWAVDKAAINAIQSGEPGDVKGIKFNYQSGMLLITLPSGRNLVYVRPQLAINKFGREGLTYEGIGNNRKWERIETYGARLVENIIQAISRDILTEGMLALDKKGFKIVAHVHDEIICEVKKGTSSVEEICEMITQPLTWAPDLSLQAEGYRCEFYKKE